MMVLITGVAGFLGSNLALAHLRKGDDVIGVDDFSSSNYDSHHFNELQKRDKFKFVECDISKRDFLMMKNHDSKIDVVYNFACPASPAKYQAMPMHTLTTCFNGTANSLEIARSFGCPIVHASTSEIYGDAEVSPQSESYRGNVNTWGSRANYDEGKRVAEALCYEHMKIGIDVRVMRIFNTYGPHLDPQDGRVVSNFIMQVGNDCDVTIFGSGQQTRSFCYVDDFIRAAIAMGNLNMRNPGRPINIGNPREFTVIELAETVMSMFKDSKSKITYKKLPQDDPTKRCPDISLAKKTLGWEPYTPLEQGLWALASYWSDLGLFKRKLVG